RARRAAARRLAAGLRKESRAPASGSTFGRAVRAVRAGAGCGADRGQSTGSRSRDRKALRPIRGQTAAPLLAATTVLYAAHRAFVCSPRFLLGRVDLPGAHRMTPSVMPRGGWIEAAFLGNLHATCSAPPRVVS